MTLDQSGRIINVDQNGRMIGVNMMDSTKQDELSFIKHGLSILEQQNRQNQMVLTALAGYIEGMESSDKQYSNTAKIIVQRNNIKTKSEGQNG